MYGIVLDVPAPAEMYDGVHARVVAQVGSAVDGLLVHVGRATETGFQVFEVWESENHYQRFNADVVFPLMDGAGVANSSLIDQAAHEFEVRGLIVPRGDVVL